MSLILTFALSGAAIVILVGAKRIEERHQRTFILLRLISRSDVRVRELSHRLTQIYSEKKEEALHFLNKQLPLKLKSHWLKASAAAKEAGEQYLQKIRDARIIKRKKEGISEFFKSIDEVEKGSGEIRGDILDEESRAKSQDQLDSR